MDWAFFFQGGGVERVRYVGRVGNALRVCPSSSSSEEIPLVHIDFNKNSVSTKEKRAAKNHSCTPHLDIKPLKILECRRTVMTQECLFILTRAAPVVGDCVPLTTSPTAKTLGTVVASFLHGIFPPSRAIPTLSKARPFVSAYLPVAYNTVSYFSIVPSVKVT